MELVLGWLFCACPYLYAQLGPPSYPRYSLFEVILNVEIERIRSLKVAIYLDIDFVHLSKDFSSEIIFILCYLQQWFYFALSCRLLLGQSES